MPSKSVMKEEDEEKLVISVKIAREPQGYHIHIENYCKDKVEFADGLPVTTKEGQELPRLRRKEYPVSCGKIPGGYADAGRGRKDFCRHTFLCRVKTRLFFLPILPF